MIYSKNSWKPNDKALLVDKLKEFFESFQSSIRYG